VRGDLETRDGESFPLDGALRRVHDRFGFVQAVLLATVLGAGLDVALFGFPETAIPFNYPFFFDIVLVVAGAIILRQTYTGLQEVKRELIELTEHQLHDVSVALSTTVSADRIEHETDRILARSYHPALVGAGALFGGLLVVGIMAWLEVLGNYPFWLMNFAFGAVHGMFIAPAAGAFVFVVTAARSYIVDINLLDPDGVGGYRRIGDTLVRLVSYGIFLVTLDFVILSSVAFTDASQFQQVVGLIYLLQLAVLIAGTVAVTLVIRMKLLAIRDRKVSRMQMEFSSIEQEYWENHDDGDTDNQSEALQLMTMTVMFNEIRRMNMWPINLYSLFQLGSSIAVSVSVFLIQKFGLLSHLSPLLTGF
jgi:hypothetical protein